MTREAGTDQRPQDHSNQPSTGRKRSRSGPSAFERGIDPRQPCSICAKPFADLPLQDDHVMPIGSGNAADGFVLVHADGKFSVHPASHRPTSGELYAPVPCGALTHAGCNMSKGATRDIGRWRHSSLSPLVIAVSKSGKRVVVPTLEILDPADELDWSLAQQEAYDRGLEALRRQGHESARHFKTIEELQSERLDLERDQRRVEAEAEADEMIAKAEAKFAAMDDWREVRAANERIANKWREVEQALEDMQVETEVGGYFDGCFEYDAAQALKRRWSATSRLGQDRANQIYSETVQSFKDSRVGQALARHLMTLDPEDRVAAYNSHEEQRAQTLRPVDRAKAEIAREAIDDLDVELAYGGSDRGFIAKLR